MSKKRVKKISKRIRPYNVVLNGFIFFTGILWNIFMLPATLKQRFDINKKAKKVHLELKARAKLKHTHDGDLL